MNISAKLAIAAPIGKTPGRASRTRGVEALVVLAILAWFGAAFAAMIGEWHGTPAAPTARVADTGALPAAERQASVRPQKPVRATLSLI